MSAHAKTIRAIVGCAVMTAVQLGGVATPSVRAAEGSGGEQQEDALDHRFNLALENHALSLRSGIFEATEEKHFLSRGDRMLTAKLFVAFDSAAGQLRFDRLQSPLPKSDEPAPQEEKGFRRSTAGWHVRYVRSLDKTLQWPASSSGAPVAIRAAGEAASPYVSPIDVQTIGVANAAEVNSNSTIDALLRLLRDSKVVSAVDLGNDVHEVTWEYSNGLGRRSLQLEMRAGGRPVKMQEYSRASTNDANWALIYVSDTEWATVNGVDVPTRCSMAWNSQGKLFSTSVYEFKWKEANTEINPDLFEYSSFELPPGTRIAEHRFGEPTYVGIVGEEK